MPRGCRIHEAAIIRLDAYREAVNAARFLRGALERAPWVLALHAETAADGESIVVVVVERLTVMRRRVIPTAVNNVRVELREPR